METTIESPITETGDKNLLKVIKDIADRFKDEYLWPTIGLVATLRPFHTWLVGRLAKIQNGEKVLEMGSGYPWYKMYSGKAGEEGAFVSLDISPNIQSRSKKICYWFDRMFKGDHGKHREQFVTGDATKLPFEGSSYDVVIASNFTGNQEKYIKEAFRVLKPGGRFITTVNELLSIPWYSRKNVKACKETGFIDTKMKIGTPGALILGFEWNWIVEATKPGEQPVQTTAPKG